MFQVRLSTQSYAPPRAVTIMTPANGWRGIEGQYRDGSWVFTLDEAQLSTEPTYFKFLLDDRLWMEGPYFRIAPAEGSTYNFDESEVTFAMSVAPTSPRDSSAVSPAAAPAVSPAAAPAVSPAAQTPLPAVTEGAMIGRVVALLTPFFTVGASWLAGFVARHVPGVKLDRSQIVAFMIAIATVCLGAAWKWLQGWQQHELLVANKLAAPIKPIVAAVATEVAADQRS
jgi:hypothetical protein